MLPLRDQARGSRRCSLVREIELREAGADLLERRHWSAEVSECRIEGQKLVLKPSVTVSSCRCSAEANDDHMAESSCRKEGVEHPKCEKAENSEKIARSGISSWNVIGEE